MQNKNAIWLFTVLLTLACLYQLSFTWFAGRFEDKAARVAEVQTDSVMQAMGDISVAGHDSVKQYYVDKYLSDNASKVAYPGLDYTYAEVKEKEINLGLDLKGGMSVTLEVSIPELIVNLSGNSKNEAFNKAINLARERQRDSQSDFITLFDEAYSEVAPEGKLAAVFHSRDNRDKFPRDASNEDVIASLRDEARAAIDNTERILRTRIDKFGVAQPTIQKQQYSGRILVELPGVKDKSRVRKVLQSTANLEFWETYDNKDIYQLFDQANADLSKAMYPGVLEQVEAKLERLDSLQANPEAVDTTADASETDTTGEPSIDELLAGEDSLGTGDMGIADEITDEERRQVNPLFSVFSPARYRDENGQFQIPEGSVVGYALLSDTAQVNRLLDHPAVKKLIPNDMRLFWDAKSTNNTLPLHAVKVTTRDGKPRLDGSSITDARQDFNYKGEVEVTMQMNAEGASIWADMTRANVGNRIAIVLDSYVQSAPIVQGEIPNGRSSISMGVGDRAVQLRNAEDLANILKAGALPAPATIVDESVVGPSLGERNIDAGLTSFALAFLMILVYMVLYYRGAGLVSDVALLANLFFLIGVLASLGAALTLPGIAGIVLTIGMSVDANVLIYERIREELRSGKGIKAAVKDGYSRAYAAIVDANLTTLLTAIVLAAFGSGPIKGFATTLIIGIFTSLFTAIFITRLLFTMRLDRDKPISFSNKITEAVFTKANYQFVARRRMFYLISGLFIVIGLGSLFTRGLNLGVDFTGGRTYTVRFEQVVELEQLRSELGKELESVPEAKTLGTPNQVKITTNYLIDENSTTVDARVEERLNAGLSEMGVDYQIIESRKVDPTISDDIEQSAILAISFSLVIIFAYIVFRFQKWQFGLGALLAMFHDVLLVLAAYSLLYGILPFSLEIDQAFIAAILTVVGYSINDTVVVFDRIREYLGEHKKSNQLEVVNSALNSTLSRTINTSLTTFLVLLMIFIFGGESIRGFVFALMIGVFFGTYSSICIATPSVVDLAIKRKENK